MLRNNLKSLHGINLSLGFVLAMGAVFIAFEYENSEPSYYLDQPTEIVHSYIAEDLPITYHKKKQIQAPPPKKAPTYDLNKLVEDSQPESQVEVELMDEADNAPPKEDVILIDIPTGPGELDDDVPIYGAEVMPEFPGGMRALQKYLKKHLDYPYLAQSHDIQGTVYVKFVVTKTGKVENIVIYRSVHTALDNEALRVVKNMPDWKPGSQRGKAVSVYFVMPIKFVLH